jgi:hypothetical protein
MNRQRQRENRRRGRGAPRRGNGRTAAPPQLRGVPFFEKEDRVQRPLPLDFQVIRMFKTVEAATLTSSTTVPVFRSFFFTLGDIADVTEMSAVFDQYKLEKVEMRLCPSITETLSSAPLIGKAYSVIDYDDANVFTSISDPLDYSNCMTWEPNDPIQIELVPHFAYAAYATGVFSSFANSPPRWIDCASSAVQHYGVKIALTTVNTAVTYTVTLRYLISFRMAH